MKWGVSLLTVRETHSRGWEQNVQRPCGRGAPGLFKTSKTSRATAVSQEEELARGESHTSSSSQDCYVGFEAGERWGKGKKFCLSHPLSISIPSGDFEKDSRISESRTHRGDGRSYKQEAVR